MVEVLCDKVAPWMAGNGPETPVAVCSQGSLLRNLADFPFPSTCSPEEDLAVVERMRAALEEAGLLSKGLFQNLSAMTTRDVYQLAEKRLIPVEALANRQQAALYLGSDQSTSITVNGSNHVCMGFLSSGLELEGTWSRLNALDDALACGVDYAFDARFGYLTSSLSHVGTGLKVSVLLHLPALSMSNGLPGLVQLARQRRQALSGLKPTVAATPVRAGQPSLSVRKSRMVRAATDGMPASASESFYYDLSGALYGDISEAQGDLFLLANLATFGLSEEEILFHVRHTALDIIGRERQARETLMQQEHRQVEDRVMRALGIARTARLLSFGEAASLLSSLRLGVDVGLLSGLTFAQLTELLFGSQSAHLRVRLGQDCDEGTLNMERADLFRTSVA